MSARRGKCVAKTQAHLGASGTCRMYGFGVTGPDPSRSWFLIAGLIVAGIVFLAVAAGILFVPGWVGIVIVRWLVNTPRGVAVTDQGVAVTRESFWNASPKSLELLLPFDDLYVATGTTKSHVRLQLGADHVWLRRREHEILVAAANSIVRRTGTPATL